MMYKDSEENKPALKMTIRVTQAPQLSEESSSEDEETKPATDNNTKPEMIENTSSSIDIKAEADTTEVRNKDIDDTITSAQQSSITKGPSDGPSKTSSSLFAILSEVHREIKKRDNSGIFAHPVTDLVAPNYSKVITHPMDMSTILARLKSRTFYTCVADYFEDCRLMFTNSMIYNPPETVYYQKARKILMYAEKALSPPSLSKMTSSMGLSPLSTSEIGTLPPPGSSLPPIPVIRSRTPSSRLQAALSPVKAMTSPFTSEPTSYTKQVVKREPKSPQPPRRSHKKKVTSSIGSNIDQDQDDESTRSATVQRSDDVIVPEEEVSNDKKTDAPAPNVVLKTETPSNDVIDSTPVDDAPVIKSDEVTQEVPPPVLPVEAPVVVDKPKAKWKKRLHKRAYTSSSEQYLPTKVARTEVDDVTSDLTTSLDSSLCPTPVALDTTTDDVIDMKPPVEAPVAPIEKEAVEVPLTSVKVEETAETLLSQAKESALKVRQMLDTLGRPMTAYLEFDPVENLVYCVDCPLASGLPAFSHLEMPPEPQNKKIVRLECGVAGIVTGKSKPLPLEQSESDQQAYRSIFALNCKKDEPIAPSFDNGFEGISPSGMETLLSTYGDRMCAQYAGSILRAAWDCGPEVEACVNARLSQATEKLHTSAYNNIWMPRERTRRGQSSGDSNAMEDKGGQCDLDEESSFSDSEAKSKQTTETKVVTTESEEPHEVIEVLDDSTESMDPCDQEPPESMDPGDQEPPKSMDPGDQEPEPSSTCQPEDVVNSSSFTLNQPQKAEDAINQSKDAINQSEDAVNQSVHAISQSEDTSINNDSIADSENVLLEETVVEST